MEPPYPRVPGAKHRFGRLSGAGAPAGAERRPRRPRPPPPDLGHASEGTSMNSEPLVIAGREFGSRLLTGTGKYDTFETMRDALEASGSEIVTVAVRRIDFDARDEDITTFIPEHMLL